MSTDVCGRLIEVMSGQPLDEYLRDQILDPLGMRDTAFYAPEAELARCSPLYTRGQKGGLHKMTGPESMVQPPKFLSGGGGLVGTASDYLAFWVDPMEEICVVFMTQLLPSDTYPIRRQLRATVLQAIID